MLSCSVWFSVPSLWMGGGLESRCVGRVYGADGAVHRTIRTVHTTYAAAYVFYTFLTKTCKHLGSHNAMKHKQLWICPLGRPEDDLIRSKHVALTKYTVFVYK